MSDLNEWLKERRVYAGWSPGHWIRSGHEIYCRDDGKEIAEWSYLSDAEAIVDAHNNLSALLTAVENVLELHQATETGVGDQYWKEPDYCPTCAEYYPCPTVRAIEGATK